VNSDIVHRLVELNRAFYQTFAAPFAATRAHVQPGARTLLGRVGPQSSVVDFGCGDGNAARWLGKHGHLGRYLGLDLSPALLSIARAAELPFAAEFQASDFLAGGWNRALPEESYTFALAFAVLHHIPGEEGRAAFLAACRRLLVPGSMLFLSNWQFFRSKKLRGRIVPWAEIGLMESDVDPGDFLLDWRQGGRGLRYVHIVDTEERLRLAALAGFTETECFESDGEGGKLADYAVWNPSSVLPQ